MKRPPYIPIVMLVVASTYLAILVTGAVDHLTGPYAVVMFLLTGANLWSEHIDRDRQ